MEVPKAAGLSMLSFQTIVYSGATRTHIHKNTEKVISLLNVAETEHTSVLFLSREPQITDTSRYVSNRAHTPHAQTPPPYTQTPPPRGKYFKHANKILQLEKRRSAYLAKYSAV